MSCEDEDSTITDTHYVKGTQDSGLRELRERRDYMYLKGRVNYGKCIKRTILCTINAWAYHIIVIHYSKVLGRIKKVGIIIVHNGFSLIINN